VFAPGAPAAVRAAVCLPTYDERENLEPMLLALRRVLEPSDVIVVVDDASPDGTGELADELAARLGGVHVLHRGGKQGLGAAYVEGFRYALGLGARFVVELDCDFSHDPNDVPRLLAAADAAGLALGSRNVTGAASPGLSPRRRLVSRAGSAYARRVLGLGVSDLTGGFKCFRRDVLEAVDPERLRSSGYAFQIETTYRAARAGYTPVELPIRFGDRAGGASKMSLGIAFEAAWRVPALRAAALAERVRASERAAAYRAVALWWAVSRMLVLGTALTVQALRWPRASWYPSLHRQPLALLGAWDGRWYRMVAERGYLAVPHHQSDVAFFPLFPVLLGALRRAGLSLDTSGLLLANLGLLVGLAALYELARTWLPQQAAVRTAVYAAVFPMGYVFSMVYPEALVLAAMALAGVFAARGRWAAAAVAAAVGGFARPEAMFLVVPLLVLAARRWRTLGDRDRRRALAAVGAAPAAVAGVALYDWRTFGNALAFSTAQRAWGRWFSPDGVARAVGELARAPGTQNVWLFRDAGLCVLYVLLLVAALRAGVPGSWVVAGGLIVLLPLESGSFTSDGRFGLLALPVYAGLGAAGSRPWLDRLVRCSGVVLLVAASATLLLRWP
jgi:dolichol-phosphate mannosyltransferase